MQLNATQIIITYSQGYPTKLRTSRVRMFHLYGTSSYVSFVWHKSRRAPIHLNMLDFCAIFLHQHRFSIDTIDDCDEQLGWNFNIVQCWNSFHTGQGRERKMNWLPKKQVTEKIVERPNNDSSLIECWKNIYFKHGWISLALNHWAIKKKMSKM